MTSPDQDKEALLREAARIIIRLNDAPDDAQAMAARDAFLARGTAEQEAFAKTAKTVRLGMRKPPTNTGLIIALLAVVSAALYFAYQPMRVAFLADWQTGFEVQEMILASGDVMHLDAGSAVDDQTDGAIRQVKLLQGGGFFEVDTSQTPFAVDTGPILATALGTSFEVSRIQEGVIVAVSEGVVEVTSDDGVIWRLEAGERLLWSTQTGGMLDKIAISDVAGWRMDRLITTGMTFGQVIAVIDRRLAGKTMILDRDLSRSKMTGVLDLSKPEIALEVVTRARQASRFSATSRLRIIRPTN